MAQPRPSLKDLMPKNPPPKPDPHFKSNVCTAVLNLAFEPTTKRMAAWLDRIIDENQKHVGAGVHYFSYQGERYFKSTVVVNLKELPREMPRLHRTLQPEMAKWLAEHRELMLEEEEAKTAIAAVLNSSNHLDDYRAMLPEGLVSALNTFTDQPGAKQLSDAQLKEAKNRTNSICDVLRRRMVKNLLI